MSIIASIELESGFGKKFESYVISTVFKKIRASAQAIRDEIKDKLQEEVKQALIATPEHRALLGGVLQAELGVPDPESRLISIIDTWTNGIEVKTKVKKDPLLTINIGILKSAYEDVLSLPASTYTYTSANTAGDMPWLRWLLLEGDKRIVKQYAFKPVRRGSRTGLGIMVASNQGGWRVPPQFAGTSVNNFATRALENIEKAVDKIVEMAIKRSIK